MKRARKKLLNVLLLSLLLLVCRKKRRWGVHPINKSRRVQSEFVLFEELKSDMQRFHQYLRMDYPIFALLCNLLEHDLKKNLRSTSIPLEHRVVLTLRYLATVSSYRQLAFSFRLGLSTVSGIVREVCIAIRGLADRYLVIPTTSEEWESISQQFWDRWNCPNTLGCIDGKHVEIKKPPKSGSLYHNYKGFFSTVLMLVCDANYKIIYADVGSYGFEGDAAIYGACAFKKAVCDGSLNLPLSNYLPQSQVKLPYFFLGDGAFPLSSYLMKPFGASHMTHEDRIYNYRISRARNRIENCFGIMAMKWRVLTAPIETDHNTADHIVWAICVLHNFLRVETNEDIDIERAVTAFRRWRGLRENEEEGEENNAKEMRIKLVEFFNTVGSVEFQEEMI